MISSLQFVSFSIPSLVTTQEFSIPTGPTPGITIFGSRAKTMPGSNCCFMRGANTGASFNFESDTVADKTWLVALFP